VEDSFGLTVALSEHASSKFRGHFRDSRNNCMHQALTGELAIDWRSKSRKKMVCLMPRPGGFQTSNYLQPRFPTGVFSNRPFNL
jgi:hypothetical protein